MKHSVRTIFALLCTLTLLVTLAACGSEEPVETNGFDVVGVWSMDTEPLYFFFEPDDTWKMVEEVEGLQAEGTYTMEGDTITLLADGQLYLEFTITDGALTFEGGTLTFAYGIEDEAAQAMLAVG